MAPIWVCPSWSRDLAATARRASLEHRRTWRSLLPRPLFFWLQLARGTARTIGNPASKPGGGEGGKGQGRTPKLPKQGRRNAFAAAVIPRHLADEAISQKPADQSVMSGLSDQDSTSELHANNDEGMHMHRDAAQRP